MGGHRPGPLRARVPARLPPDRQQARRRGPHPGGLRPGVPVAVDLHARDVRGLAAPHHDQPLPRRRPAPPAHPDRRHRRRLRAARRRPASCTRPSAAFEHANLDLDVQRALGDLSPEYRAAVVLCDIEGLSYEEIAVTLGIKLGTVRSRIHRARAQLRRSLAHRAPHALLAAVDETADGRPGAAAGAAMSHLGVLGLRSRRRSARRPPRPSAPSPTWRRAPRAPTSSPSARQARRALVASPPTSPRTPSSPPRLLALGASLRTRPARATRAPVTTVPTASTDAAPAHRRPAGRVRVRRPGEGAQRRPHGPPPQPPRILAGRSDRGRRRAGRAVRARRAPAVVPPTHPAEALTVARPRAARGAGRRAAPPSSSSSRPSPRPPARRDVAPPARGAA